MKKRLNFVLLTAVFLLLFVSVGVQCSKVQSQQQPDRARKTSVTGEIAEGYNDGYIIRTKTPSMMVMTILNPEPKILDEYVKSGKTVEIDVWIVSGDNIKIVKIDGQNYPYPGK